MRTLQIAMFSVGFWTHYWLWGRFMGEIRSGSFSVYGAGANALGPLGAVVGWPLIISLSLIAWKVSKWISGEWKATPPQAPCYTIGGLAILIAAITMIPLGGRDSV